MVGTVELVDDTVAGMSVEENSIVLSPTELEQIGTNTLSFKRSITTGIQKADVYSTISVTVLPNCALA